MKSTSSLLTSSTFGSLTPIVSATQTPAVKGKMGGKDGVQRKGREAEAEKGVDAAFLVFTSAHEIVDKRLANANH